METYTRIKTLMETISLNVTKYLTYIVLNKQKLETQQTPIPKCHVVKTSTTHVPLGPPIGKWTLPHFPLILPYNNITKMANNPTLH